MPDLSGFVRIGGQVRRLNNYDGGLVVNIGLAFTSFLWRRKFFENSCNRIARRGTYYLNVRCSLKSRLRGRESLGSSSNDPRADDGPARGNRLNLGELRHITR